MTVTDIPAIVGGAMAVREALRPNGVCVLLRALMFVSVPAFAPWLFFRLIIRLGLLMHV
jgi:hypothetical protein